LQSFAEIIETDARHLQQRDEIGQLFCERLKIGILCSLESDPVDTFASALSMLTTASQASSDPSVRSEF
jgi:hypothetical protein